MKTRPKIYLRNKENFCPETISFYQSFSELVQEKEAEIIIINDFEPIETGKIVAANMTGIEHIKAKEVISLRGEKSLYNFSAVAELSLSMLIYLLRIFRKEEAKGKTLGIIGGNGRIGRQLTRMAEFMGLNVIYYDDK